MGVRRVFDLPKLGTFRSQVCLHTHITVALALLFALITFAVSVANLFFFIHGPRLRYKELRLEQPARKGSEEQLKKPEPAAVEGQTRWEMD